MESRDKAKDDSWSKAIIEAVNIVVVTALVSTIFGLCATHGAIMMIRILY